MFISKLQLRDLSNKKKKKKENVFSWLLGVSRFGSIRYSDGTVLSIQPVDAELHQIQSKIK